MRQAVLGCLAVVLMFVTGTTAPAAPPRGIYEGDGLTMVIDLIGKSKPERVKGTIALGEQSFEYTATWVDEQGMRGSFQSDDAVFEFTAVFEGDTLVFKTGDATYRLKVRSTPGAENPLSTPKAANPLEKPKSSAKIDEPGGAGDDRRAGSAGGGEVLKYVPYSVNDPQVNSIEALTLLVPADWNVEGGVVWDPNSVMLAGLLMRISEPGGAAAIHSYPDLSFTWQDGGIFGFEIGSNYLGNIVRPPITDAREALGGLLQHYRPDVQGAEIVSLEEIPEIARAIAKNIQEQGLEKSVHTHKVRIAYTQNETPVEEDFYFTLSYATSPSFPGYVLWQTNGIVSMRARKGELDAKTPMMRVTIDSARVSQDWFSQYLYVRQLFMQRMQQGIQNAGKISEHIARNSEEIRQMYSQAYEAQQKSHDEMSRNWSNAMRGHEDYRTPDGEMVNLPGGYTRGWTNARGEYILTSDTLFNPNEQNMGDWQELQKQP